jgi:hypothetical protein
MKQINKIGCWSHQILPVTSLYLGTTTILGTSWYYTVKSPDVHMLLISNFKHQNFTLLKHWSCALLCASKYVQPSQWYLTYHRKEYFYFNRLGHIMQQNGVHYYSSPKLNLQTIDRPCKLHQDYTGRHWTLKRSLLAHPVFYSGGAVLQSWLGLEKVELTTSNGRCTYGGDMRQGQEQPADRPKSTADYYSCLIMIRGLLAPGRPAG